MMQSVHSPSGDEPRGDDLGSPAALVYSSRMLDVGDAAPDFAVGKTTLRRILEKRSAVVFFFPKAFTPG